jgi:hypothetical protein
MKELNLNERQSEQLFNKGKKKKNYENSNISPCQNTISHKILYKKPKSFKRSIITLYNHHTERQKGRPKKGQKKLSPHNSTITTLKFQHKL